ncbi:MAG: BspA family leucine-rich repeat surface protein [Acholeplasmataceae bacterium]|nr:BspA family leucine-rich repeat surface protein [Acholeplasmataceae bacterium]
MKKLYWVFVIFLLFLLASCTTETYTITWKNDDGFVLKIDEKVSLGDMPSYGGVTPTKKETAEYSYTFTGWSPEITIVSESITYTATFSSNKKSYSVVFKNHDESILSEQFIEYGLSATPPNDPEKSGFSFNGWDKDYQSIKEDMVIYALYKENLLAVTWKNDDGEVLDIDENINLGDLPSYTGTTPQKLETAEFYYTFIGWNPEITIVSESITYTAIFSSHKKSYSVVFKNHDESILSEQFIEYGSSATPPKNPEKAGFSFNGWDKDYQSIKEDMVIYALYKENLLTITWKNDNGKILDINENVKLGETPTYTGPTPVKTATAEFDYTFKGWTPVIKPATNSTTYTATYNATKRSYSVIFKDYDDLELLKTTVPYGTNVLPPPNPNRKVGHHFANWDEDFSFITKDTIVYAIYEINTYTVVWKNDEGDILQFDEDVPYLTTPEYIRDIPTKVGGEHFIYEFIGFSPKISPVVKNITYIAQFKPIYDYPDYYILLTDADFVGEGDGWVIYNSNYEYIIIPEYIKGIKVTKVSLNRNTRLLQNKPFVKGVVFENPHNITDVSFLFYKHQSEEIELDYLYLPNITTTESMFESSKALSLDLSSIETSNVTKMNAMFKSAEAKSINFTGFNTQKVTNFKEMFAGSHAEALDLSSFDTTNAISMEEMFHLAHALSIDLSSFNTSKVSNMNLIFYGSKALALDLSSFDTSLITSMISMFAFSEALTIDLSSFNTSNVIDMSYMFSQAKALSLDLSSFDTSKVYNMDRMFYWSRAKSIDFSSFNTSKVSNMSSMFERSRVEILDLSTFDFSGLLFASSIFKNCAATIGYLATQELCERFNKQVNIFVVK